MKKYFYENLNSEQLNSLTKRSTINFEQKQLMVKDILDDIKLNGLKAAIKYAEKFDGPLGNNFLVTNKEFTLAEKNLSSSVKKALINAYNNILKYHKLQKPNSYSLETSSGVICSREFRAIENIGLYVPGGTAPLPSTMLMLGIPAKIAGCKRVIVCSPAKNGKINDSILFAAKLCGINEFYKIGGIQAIGIMAYGDHSISKADKIFGPGNQFVTLAKLLVSIDPDGCSIDMAAGPSEVLVIADKFANPSFVAADLLAQAEHGTDSEVVLITNEDSIANKVLNQIEIQLQKLPRKDIIKKSLMNSFILITKNLNQAISFSNNFAPEHLILHLKNSKQLKKQITNAGSVFLGKYSPEAVGDYASGTNHSLPTSGYAKSFSGLTVEAFMKSISFQTLTKNGLRLIADTVEILAETEKLEAHKNAVNIRLRQK